MLKFMGSLVKYILSYMLFAFSLVLIILTPAIILYCFMLRFLPEGWMKLIITAIYFYLVGSVVYKTGKYVLKRFWAKQDY